MGFSLFGRKKHARKHGKKKPAAVSKKDRLVRDKTPKLIKKKGMKPVTRTATKDELISALKEKILAEASELRKATTQDQELEEIIDIMEAINTYMKQREISVQNVERMRKYKLRKHGGFSKAVILEGVE